MKLKCRISILINRDETTIEIIERGEDTEHNRVLNQNKWQEAEEKTFKNPLIFVKK